MSTQGTPGTFHPDFPVRFARLSYDSSLNDSVTAFNTRTGEELWRFHAGGPVRFAPAGMNGRVFFVSDDGHLYCLGAADGRLSWRVKGGPPQDRRTTKPGERVFSVSLQGERVIEAMDLAKEAGTGVVVLKEFETDPAGGTAVRIELSPVRGSRGPLLSGVVLIWDYDPMQ